MQISTPTRFSRISERPEKLRLRNSKSEILEIFPERQKYYFELTFKIFFRSERKRRFYERFSEFPRNRQKDEIACIGKCATNFSEFGG